MKNVKDIEDLKPNAILHLQWNGMIAGLTKKQLYDFIEEIEGQSNEVQFTLFESVLKTLKEFQVTFKKSDTQQLCSDIVLFNVLNYVINENPIKVDLGPFKKTIKSYNHKA